jgi:anti-sigma factor RsiW
MKCHEFKEWLLNHDISKGPFGIEDRPDNKGRVDEMGAEIKTHLDHCPDCEKLAALDRRFDGVLHRYFQPKVTPPRLLERIELDLLSRESKQHAPSFFRSIRIFAPALATAVLLLVIFNPFAQPGIGSLDELGKFAFADHDSPVIMEIKRGDKNDIQGWFNNVMGLKITIPNLTDSGYRLIGARKCQFGNCSAAHLLYDKNGDQASLYILDLKDIHFKVNRTKEYMLRAAGKTVRIWRNNHQVHALVI